MNGSNGTYLKNYFPYANWISRLLGVITYKDLSIYFQRRGHEKS